ncbi:hypothetical protein [Xenorhabdus indica]|uniref:hypothetical protein n=1 Tax=Xenorhabdus indica TaxID=333964 RepID=UPI003B84532F
MNNRQGQLTALRNATLALTHSLDNTGGQLQAHQHLSARGDRLALANTGGDIRAGQTLSVSGVPGQDIQ